MKERHKAIWLPVSLCVLTIVITSTSFPQAKPKSDPLPKEDGIPAGGFRLSATVNTQQFVSGEPILLKVSLSNTTNETLHILGTIFQLSCEVEVRNEGGELVSLTEEGKRLERHRGIDISLGRIFIGAGKEWTETLQVNRLYEMVAAGEYRIVVRRGVPGRVLHQPVTVSNTVVLRVIDNA
jgi:hypothetical protein